MYSILETGFAVTSPARGPLGEGAYRKNPTSQAIPVSGDGLVCGWGHAWIICSRIRFSYSMKGVESNSARPDLPWSAKGSPGFAAPLEGRERDIL